MGMRLHGESQTVEGHCSTSHTTLAQCGARVILGCSPYPHLKQPPTLSSTPLLEIPPEGQAQMRAVLRRARYGYLLAFHILLLCAAS